MTRAQRPARHSFVYPAERRSTSEISLACDDSCRSLARVAGAFTADTLLRTFSVADITKAYTLRWAAGLAQYGDLLEGAPDARAYVERQCARPAFPRELYG